MTEFITNTELPLRGLHNMWIKLPRDLVDRIHDRMIDISGGSYGVLNSGNIDSALSSPLASFGGVDLYDTDLKKCCKLFHAIVSNHGYVDGNKRVGLFLFLLSLELCDINMDGITHTDAEELATSIAGGITTVDELYEIVSDLLGME